MLQRTKQFAQIALALLILGLALFLRVRRLDTTGVWADQALTLTTAMHWVNGGAMPLAANKSSAGVMKPPMIEYLVAAALRVWPDVLSVALMTLVSGMVAVALPEMKMSKCLKKKLHIDHLFATLSSFQLPSVTCHGGDLDEFL